MLQCSFIQPVLLLTSRGSATSSNLLFVRQVMITHYPFSTESFGLLPYASNFQTGSPTLDKLVIKSITTQYASTARLTHCF
jgi:hypothetical protein